MPGGIRIQSIVSPPNEAELQKLAEKSGHTLSKYVALVLERHVKQNEHTCEHREVARIAVQHDIHTLRCIRCLNQFEVTTDQIRRQGLVVLVPQHKESTE